MRPLDVSRDGGKVARNGRAVLLRFVQFLHLLELGAVVLKNDVELGIHVAFEVLALQDGLKLSQQVEALLDAGDALEAVVDEILQLGLQVGNFDVELNVVAVELVVVKIQQIVVLGAKLPKDVLETCPTNHQRRERS